MVHPSQLTSAYRRRRNPRASLALTLNGTVRSVSIRPWVAGSALGVVVVLMTAFIGAAAYLIYRDDLLGATLARQVRMQYEYEDRLAALRSEIDRVTSRNLVRTHTVEEQLAVLLEREAELRQRHSDLSSLLEEARRAGVDLPNQTGDSAKVAPDADTGSERQPRKSAALNHPFADGRADIITGSLLRGNAATGSGRTVPDPKAVIATVSRSLDRVQQRQTAALEALSTASDAELVRISAALAPLGAQAPTEPRAEPQGGPFIPAGPLHFVERQAVLSRTLADIVGLRLAAAELPLRAPVARTRVSSRFGYRTDPFLGRTALHAGLDFVAAPGAPVQAAGAGTVVSAGWSGGYGQLVEIQHANGLSTRYGHLSAVLVREGDRVAAGALIGRVGSTGRSTGPHLHYETRRDGNAIDPALFLAAGRAL